MKRALHPDRVHQHRVQDIHRGEVNFWWNTMAPLRPRSIDTARGHRDLTERRSRFDRTKAGGQFPGKSNFQHDLFFVRIKFATC